MSTHRNQPMNGVVSVMSLAQYEEATGDGPVTDRTQWSPEGFVPTPLREKHGDNLVAVTVAYPEDGLEEIALVAVVDMDHGVPLWTNPASEGTSTLRYIAGAVHMYDAQHEHDTAISATS